jgi:uncharacterized membrane protein
MLFFAVLVTVYAATWLVPARRLSQRDRWRIALAGGMVVAGVGHLVTPGPFLAHLPPWTPAPGFVVAASGLAEIGLGIGLLLPQPYRRWVGLALAVFLVVVFPANIYVAIAGVEVDGQPGGIYPWLRLGFQPLFVWLAVWSTGDGPGTMRTRTARRDAVRPHDAVDVSTEVR